MSIEFRQRLLDDMIAVEMLGEPASKGRIKLPSWQKYLRGKVIAVGPGRMLPFGERAPMETKVGDTITFSPTAGMESDLGIGRPVRLMRDPDGDTVEEKEVIFSSQYEDNGADIVKDIHKRRKCICNCPGDKNCPCHDGHDAGHGCTCS